MFLNEIRLAESILSSRDIFPSFTFSVSRLFPTFFVYFVLPSFVFPDMIILHFSEFSSVHVSVPFFPFIILCFKKQMQVSKLKPASVFPSFSLFNCFCFPFSSLIEECCDQSSNYPRNNK